MTYSIEKVIKERRTIKRFKSTPIALETIEELLTLATYAPNHKLREPWHFHVFLDEGKNKLIQGWKAAKESGKFPRPMKEEKLAQLKEVPVFIVVTMPVDPRHQVFEEDFAAVSASIQNFMLAAWEKEIGVLWNTEGSISDPIFRDAVGVTPGEKVVAILQVGYPEMIPNLRERTPIAEKMTVHRV
jgi:nitroreductase